MKKQLAIALVALWMVTTAQAQWRIGVTGGVAFNHPTIDKQYMTDLVYKDRCGLSFGLMGQYDFNDWLGVRAELDWTQKNYPGIVGVRYQTPVWLYIPHMVTMSKDKQLFEGVGVTPDIDVDFDITLSQTTGRDTQLDRALQYLRTGN